MRRARPCTVEFRAVMPRDGILRRAAKRRRGEVVVEARGFGVESVPLPEEQNTVCSPSDDEMLDIALVVFGGEVEQRGGIPPQSGLNGQVAWLSTTFNHTGLRVCAGSKMDSAPRRAREQTVVRRIRADAVRQPQARIVRADHRPSVRRDEGEPEAYLHVPRRGLHRTFHARHLATQVFPHEPYAVRKRFPMESLRLRRPHLLLGGEVVGAGEFHGEQVGRALRGEFGPVRRGDAHHTPVRRIHAQGKRRAANILRVRTNRCGCNAKQACKDAPHRRVSQRHGLHLRGMSQARV